MSKPDRIKHQLNKACLGVDCLVPVNTHLSWSVLHDKSHAFAQNPYDLLVSI